MAHIPATHSTTTTTTKAFPATTTVVGHHAPAPVGAPPLLAHPIQCTQCNHTTVMPASNVAYDAAIASNCPSCNTAYVAPIVGHSERDREFIMKKEQQHTEKHVTEVHQTKDHHKDKEHHHKDKQHHNKDKESLDMHHGVHRVDPDFKRDLDREHKQDKTVVADLDAADRREREKLAPKLHHCNTEYHSSYRHKGFAKCDVCDQPI